MKMRNLWTLTALGLALSGVQHAAAQAPKANGETLKIQNYAGTTGNLHAVIAKEKGLCDKYNFKCELNTINSGILGLQALVGKTIDVALTGTELTASTVNAGGAVAIVGMGLPANVLFLAARADVALPNKAKGYPAVMADFKGMKIGVPARGAGAEVFMHVMLREGGLQPDGRDVRRRRRASDGLSHRWWSASKSTPSCCSNRSRRCATTPRLATSSSI